MFILMYQNKLSTNCLSFGVCNVIHQLIVRKINPLTFYPIQPFQTKKESNLSFVQWIMIDLMFEIYYLKLLYLLDDLNELLKINIMAYEDFNISP